MPRIDEYVRIGRCMSYGDFDWSIELAKVQHMPREKIDELLLTMFHCQRQIWEYWREANQAEQAQAQIEHADPDAVIEGDYSPAREKNK